MAAGAGGEAVFVFFWIDDGRCGEANMLSRTWSHVPNPNILGHRHWWLNATKTPWVWNSEISKDDRYTIDEVTERFGSEVPWFYTKPPPALTADDVWNRPIQSEITKTDEPAWRTLQAINSQVFTELPPKSTPPLIPPAPVESTPVKKGVGR